MKIKTSGSTPKNITDVEYNDVLEEKRQALEAFFKEFQEDYKRKIASCFGKTRQGVVKKEKFIMPTLKSKVTSNISTSSILGKKMNDSQKLIKELLINLAGQVETLTKGKAIDHSYTTKTINPSLSTAPACAP